MPKNKHHQNKNHIPVLLDEVIELLDPLQGESYLDLTVGYGGHAKAVLEKTCQPQKAVLVDRDRTALASLGDLRDAGASLVHKDFAQAVHDIRLSEERFDIIMMDLGVSSPQLDNGERGFSFRFDAPLDMRMDQTAGKSAKDLVNDLPEQVLASILKEYGEEPKAKRIARAIVNHRPVSTTSELADIVEKIYRRRGRIHPATRTFQALRIATNGELEQLQKTLPLIPEILNEGGRLAAISFHSLEDRLVKRFLKTEFDQGYEARMRPLTKKPIVSASQSVHNPRARSAKLRGAVKIKQKQNERGMTNAYRRN